MILSELFSQGKKARLPHWPEGGHSRRCGEEKERTWFCLDGYLLPKEGFVVKTLPCPYCGEDGDVQTTYTRRPLRYLEYDTYCHTCYDGAPDSDPILALGASRAESIAVWNEQVEEMENE